MLDHKHGVRVLGTPGSAEGGTVTLNGVAQMLWSAEALTPLRKRSIRLGKAWRVSAYGTVSGATNDIVLEVYYGTIVGPGPAGTVTIPLADAAQWYLDAKVILGRKPPFSGAFQTYMFVSAFGLVTTGTGKSFALSPVFIPLNDLGPPPIGDGIFASMRTNAGAPVAAVTGGPILEELN